MDILLVREFEAGYELVDILRFERGRRYIYRLVGDREYFIHVVAMKEATYVEFWHPNYAVPLLVFKIGSGEELSRVFVLLKALVGR
ncbi:MAG: hypothetical protein ABWK05_05725 [Pyrobaculum sp.]